MHFIIQYLRTDIINCGVPQGSMVRTLFLLYISHIPQVLSNSLTYLYGDNTSFFYQDKDVTEIGNVLQKEFANVCGWFVDNKLPMHFDEYKTTFKLFSRQKITELNITQIDLDRCFLFHH